MCSEPVPGQPDFVHEGPEVVLESLLQDDDWLPVMASIRVRNRSGRPLHMLLANYSADYGVSLLANEPIDSGDAWVNLWGGNEQQCFYMEDGQESLDRLQLIVSTQPIDGFLFFQDGIHAPAQRAAGAPPRSRKARKEDWLTRKLAACAWCRGWPSWARGTGPPTTGPSWSRAMRA